MRIATVGWRLIACLAISQAAIGEAGPQHPRIPFRTVRPMVQPRVIPRDRNQTARLRPLMLAPVIESMTPDHGRQGDLIVIKGANFPAAIHDPKAKPNPVDPGFAIVRFGKWVAPNVPITSTTIWVTVPKMPEGAVMVTIQNRHGFSKPAPFTVERAWWDFWSPKPGQ